MGILPAKPVGFTPVAYGCLGDYDLGESAAPPKAEEDDEEEDQVADDATLSAEGQPAGPSKAPRRISSKPASRKKPEDPWEGRPHVPTRKAVMWVFENLPKKGLEPADSPSAGAWGLLLWAQESGANAADFYRSIWSKTLPTKAQIDHEAEATHTDRDLGAMLELLVDAANKGSGEVPDGPDESTYSGPQDMVREPGLSQDACAVGEQRQGGGEGPVGGVSS